jgi:hypothetical protein
MRRAAWTRITVRHSPRNESLRTSVSLEPLKGMWRCSRSSALQRTVSTHRACAVPPPQQRPLPAPHAPDALLECQQALVDLCAFESSLQRASRARTLRLHGGRARCTCLSLSVVSLARSLPAKSMKENLPDGNGYSGGHCGGRGSGEGGGRRRGSVPISLERSRAFLSATCMMACERDESALAPVAAVDLQFHTRHEEQVHHTSHLTPHTSHLTTHTPQPTPHTSIRIM